MKKKANAKSSQKMTDKSKANSNSCNRTCNKNKESIGFENESSRSCNNKCK